MKGATVTAGNKFVIVARSGVLRRAGTMGGFKRSSQHSEVGGCDEHSKAAIGTVWTGAITFTRTAARRGARRTDKILAGNRHGAEQRRCCARSRSVAAWRNRWFQKAGGMPPAMFRSSAKPLSGRYLSLVEREEIALLRVQGYSIQAIGRRLGRAASTISRELRRNAATRSGGLEYRATAAQWHADRSARRPKPTKLALNTPLRTYVEENLPASSWPRAALLSLVLPFRGRAAGMVRERIGDGLGPGARSRLPDGCRSTSLTT